MTIHNYFIYKNIGYFAKNCSQLKKLKDFVHLFKEKTDHAGIYLNKQDDLEAVFTLKEEPSEDIIFSIDIFTILEDIKINNLYLISCIGEDE